MMRYSIEPIIWIFVKGSGLLSFAKNMGRKLDKNIIRNLCEK